MQEGAAMQRSFPGYAFRKFSGGFTLIELVCVIAILGIMAASAAPKFVALQTDARVARLMALKGALKSADTMITAKALVQGSSLDGDSHIDGGYFEYNGVKYSKKYGHIDRNNMGYFIEGTPPGLIDGDKIAKSRTGNVNGYQFDCRNFKGVCAYDWCDCWANNTKIKEFPNNNNVVIGDSGQTSKDAAKAAQYFIPRGMEPSKFETDKCLVVYQQPVLLNDKKTIYPSKVGIVSDGC